MTIANGIDLITVLFTISLPFVVYFVGRQAKHSADQAVVAAERVENTLVISTSDTTQRLQEIHVLVNSRLTEALRKIDRLEQRLLAETGELPTGEPPQKRPR